jgi:serine/threonine protein kinase
VFDFFDDKDNIYIVQENLGGGDLTNYEQKLDDACISVVAFQVLYALKFCHE